MISVCLSVIPGLLNVKLAYNHLLKQPQSPSKKQFSIQKTTERYIVNNYFKSIICQNFRIITCPAFSI